MGRRVTRRTREQWKLEIRRIRRMRKAVELAKANDTLLTLNVVSRLDSSATFLEHWVAALDTEPEGGE